VCFRCQRRDPTSPYDELRASSLTGRADDVPLLATLVFVSGALLAQLNTGTIEGTLRDMANAS